MRYTAMNVMTPDPSDLSAAAESHRRELHLHCYRLLANFEEAEDAVQETLTRAWQARGRFDGANLRAWLYTIATHVCLDRMRQARAQERSYAEVSWLQPYPDLLLEELVVARETIELAFLAIIQLLPPRQRAALILRDVLDWSAADTAAALDMSVPAVNSALQRGRATVAEKRWPHGPDRPASSREREILARFIDAHERMDPDAAMALVRDDVDITMPPLPLHYRGKSEMTPLWERARDMGEWRLLPAPANHMPAAASYVRKPGDDVFRALKLDVLSVQGDRISATTTFNATLFDAFGLPGTLAA